MRAVAVYPDKRQLAIVERPQPALERPGDAKIRMLEVGVCGTDRDITSFEYGTPPPGCEYLILGHESLGQVAEVGPDVKNVQPGDLVVGMVRLPCHVASCTACRASRQDFCFTGEYGEHGIKGLHGFMTGFVTEDARYLHVVPREMCEVAVLTEPLTIAEKALIQVSEIQSRLPWWGQKHKALVLGAGPVGLLGAMLFMHSGFETYVYSRGRKPGTKADLAESIGARYVSSQDVPPAKLAGLIGNIDVVYEAAGAPQLAFEVLRELGSNGVFVFTGIPRREPPVRFDTDAIMRNMVLKNQILLGTVNAGWDAFEAAIRDLAAFERRWPKEVRSLITGRFPMDDFRDPVFGKAGGIKNVIIIDSGA